MYQIDNSTAVVTIPASTATGNPGFFTDGNPATGVPATIMPAEYQNMLMMEIINVLTAAGVTPSKSNFTQLLTAIKAVNRQGVILTDTGTAGAYAAANTPSLTSLPATGYIQRVNIANANTGASTYAPDGLAAKPIYGLGLQPLQGGELPVGVAVLMYLVQAGVNGGNGAWIVIESLGGASQVAPATKSQHALSLGQANTLYAGLGAVPGQMEWFATMAPPAAFLAANGAAYSRVTYAALFSAISAQPTGTVTSGSNSITSVANPSSMWVGMPISGPGIPAGTTVTAVGASTITLSANATATSTTTVAICPHGVGDGSTTFNVPDGRGVEFRGWDNGRGLDPSRVMGSYQADQFPSHTHIYGTSINVQSGTGTIVITGGAATAAVTAAAGTGTETRVKNIALLACIKF